MLKKVVLCVLLFVRGKSQEVCQDSLSFEVGVSSDQTKLFTLEENEKISQAADAFCTHISELDSDQCVREVVQRATIMCAVSKRISLSKRFSDINENVQVPIRAHSDGTVSIFEHKAGDEVLSEASGFCSQLKDSLFHHVPASHCITRLVAGLASGLGQKRREEERILPIASVPIALGTNESETVTYRHPGGPLDIKRLEAFCLEKLQAAIIATHQPPLEPAVPKQWLELVPACLSKLKNELPKAIRASAPASSEFNSLFGEALVTCGPLEKRPQQYRKSGIPTKDALRGTRSVALFFCASWSKACSSFLPEFIAFYQTQKSALATGLEVIFISSDRDNHEWQTSTIAMPWLSMSFDTQRAQNLRANYNIEAIPSVLFLDAATAKPIPLSTSSESYDANAGLRFIKSTMATLSAEAGADSSHVQSHLQLDSAEPAYDEAYLQKLSKKIHATNAEL